jgi:EmrB/QacA subfamily drug resistance transporter
MGERTSTVVASEVVPRHVWWLATVLAFGGVMAGLDASIVNVGLSTIGDDLGASLVAVSWVQSGYLLALAATLPACGWAIRRIGAGRLWIWSLAAFTIVSVLCALAPGVEALIAFRIAQGVAGGLLVPAGMTVLGQVAGPSRMGRVLATTSVPAILAPAVGPVVGAGLISQLSWHWLFLVNLPVGAVAVALGLRVVPRGVREPGNHLDRFGLALVAVGLPALTYGLAQATEQATLTSGTVLVSLTVGVVATAVFLRRSSRSAHPLLDLTLFGDRVYRAAAVETFLNGTALFGGLVVMPLYFQVLLQRDVVASGLLLVAFSAGAAVTFPVAGVLTDRYGGARVAVLGLVVTTVSTLPFALLPADADLLVVETLQVLRGIGLALSGMPIVSLALARAGSHQLPDATAQVNILSRVGGALGSALFVVLLAGGLVAGASDTTTLGAFHATFWWLTGASLAALAAACWLIAEQRRARTLARRDKHLEHRH